MGDRRYIPGRRPRSGKMSEDRAAWLKVIFLNLDMYIKQWSEKEELLGLPEYGPNVVVIVSNNRGQRLTFDVTNLTLSELEALRDFGNLLWELAEPIIRQRDKVAKNEFDKGSDAVVRIYRDVPRFVVRERIVEAHRQGILNGFENAADSVEPAGNSNGSPGEGGPGLAEPESKGCSTEDASTSPDQP